MKLLSLLSVTLAFVAPLSAQTPTTTAGDVEAQVKQELNEAARAYREGDFAVAQAHSEKALLLDPQNKTAPMFVARTIHAQYKPGDFTPENVAKARQAIIAYQAILSRSPADDEAYKAVAYLYGAIKEDELLREWVFQRASNVSFDNAKRAEAYTILPRKTGIVLSRSRSCQITKSRLLEETKHPLATACLRRRLNLNARKNVPTAAWKWQTWQ